MNTQSKVAIIPSEGGGVSIMIFANNIYVPANAEAFSRNDFIPVKEEGYREATVEELAERDIPSGTTYYIVDAADIPSDRYFRNAWNYQDGFLIDMEVARSIHMGNIRNSRNAELKKLDVETMKGIDVQAQKQALRDIPQEFDLSVYATPEELKSAWPEGLPRPEGE